MIFRNGVLILSLMSFTACTTMRPIEDFSPSQLRQEVEVGDEVEIVATNGKRYELEVTKVEADALYGEADSGKRYKVPFESIQSIRVEKVSGWRTAGVTVVVYYVLTAIAIGYALSMVGGGC